MSLVVLRHAPLVRFWSDRGLLDVSPPAEALVERLGDWLDVRQAIALHQLLGQESVEPASDQAVIRHPGRSTELPAILAQLRDEILTNRPVPGLWRNPMPETPAQRPPDWGELWEPYRRFMVDHQKQMALLVGRERRRLREALSAYPAIGATLADMDAAFERAIGPKEAQCLAVLPRHTEHYLRQLLADAEIHDIPFQQVMRTFERDLRLALVHELDLRAQPVLGLLETLTSLSP